MKKARTPFLQQLIRSFQKARWAEKHPGIDTRTLLDLSNSDEWSRRKFISEVSKAALVTGVLSTLPLSSCKPKTEATTQETGKHDGVKIAIVGGGMAGLRCAYVLQKAGITAQVYEADKRTGGRMYSRQEDFGTGLWAEFGGEFLDSDHDDMFDLVSEFKLETFDTYTDTAHREVCFIGDKFYTEEDIINSFRKVNTRIASDLESCGAMYDTQQASILDTMNLEEYIRSLESDKWFQDMLIAAYVGEYGLDASQQSALNFVDLIGTDLEDGFKIFGESDERYKVVGGNQKIVDALAEKLENQIHKEHRLTALRETGNSYTLTFNEKLEVKADYVVLAIPFTTLRLVDMQLTDMDPVKKQCINEMGYGQNSKLLLGMNTRVWRNEKPAKAGFLTNNNVHTGWDNSQMQNGNTGAAGYTIFLGGTPSIQMAQAAKAAGLRDSVPDTYVQQYLDQMEKVFKGFKASYSGVQKAALWPNNPFTLGSYACFKPGQWLTIGDKAFEPVGNVHFAGEHCSEDFLGYMNGAAQTGRFAAEAIIAKLG
jgi:monoamine oxidase